ncbi:MAG: DUF3991 and toprim domain-containing protein [Lachnospiraceae bacterium]|nr:DUF3991 and toprim domain-containing protein [Lachnospiraceae bacterium]
MSGYVHFTEEQKQRANAVNLEIFLSGQGERLLRSGREKRLASDHSITVRGNRWYDHAEGKGGCAIDFVQKFYGQSFPDAVTMLLGGEQGQAYPCSESVREETAKPFVLPPVHSDMRRAFAYLTRTRCIDRNVVSAFAEKKMLNEDAKYHNVVFVGYDRQGVARHAHKRGTYTKGDAFKGNVEGCDPRYSFHFTGVSDTLYVFEAPIDMLSFITLYQKDWQNHSYVALCGVSEHAMLQMMKDCPQINRIALCLDNDEAGMKARERLGEILKGRCYQEKEVFSLLPEKKDWNEDLTEQSSLGLSMSNDRAPKMQMA